MPVVTTPQAGIGITLGYRTASTGSFTNMAELMDDCEFDGWDTTIIPLPILASGSVPKAPGRTDYGTFSASFYLVGADAGVAEIFTLAASKATVYWQVQLLDGSSATTGSTFVFQGFISNVKPGNFTGEDAPHQEFTIAISGVVTYTAAT